MAGISENTKVVVTRPIVGLCFMQVCVTEDATDEEILHVCNRENPAGTNKGWTKVLREKEECLGGEIGGSVQCQSDSKRYHLLVSC